MIIKIIAVSKIKDSYILAGIKEYSKRLSGYCSLKIIEVDAQKVKKSITLDTVKDTEAKALLKNVSPDSYVIALDETGKQYTSIGFADYLSNTVFQSGLTEVVFIIGGSNGLSQEIIKRADFVFSLSKLTFPHQLVRLFLLEQLYRVFKISKNEPYHK